VREHGERTAPRLDNLGYIRQGKIVHERFYCCDTVRKEEKSQAREERS
jgi:hypothetical protein